MSTKTILASHLGMRHVGRRVVVTMPNGTVVAGVLNSVERLGPAPSTREAVVNPGSSPSWVQVIISGVVIAMPPNYLVEIEQVAACAAKPDVLLQASSQSAVEAEMSKAMRQQIVGRISGVAVTVALVAASLVAIMSYGLMSPALSGHTALAAILLLIPTLVLLRLLENLTRVERWQW